MGTRFVFVIACLLTITACQPTVSYINNHGFIYGTVYNVKYESTKDLQEGIEAEMNRLNHSLSTFDSLSVLSKVNRNQEVVLDDNFLRVFNKAMDVSKITDGDFDITVAPMVNVWGFGFKHKEDVTSELIDSLKLIVGYQKIRLVNGKIEKEHPNTMIDCSAIAKGYACDVVAKYLARQGCKNYMVEIGGEVVAHGINAKGKSWTIGVSKPVDNPDPMYQELKAIVSLKDKALATSGNYRNFYIKDGKKYAHTINPHTGYPVQHSLLSASVLADNCMTADAFATSFMVMGIERAQKIIDQTESLDAYFIYSDENGEMKTWSSDGFKQILDKEIN